MFTDGLAGGPGIAYRLFSLRGPGRTDSVYRWFGRGPRNSLGCFHCRALVGQTVFTDGLAGGPVIAYMLFSLPGPGWTDSVSAGTLILIR